MHKQTPAEAPMPLCLPTPSLGYQKDIDDAEKTADAVSASLHGLKKRLRFLCKHKAEPFSSPVSASFPGMCYLTTATISRHMGLLLDAGLVRARRGENRIYYDLNRDAVTNLCDVVCGVLLQQ